MDISDDEKSKSFSNESNSFLVALTLDTWFKDFVSCFGCSSRINAATSVNVSDDASGANGGCDISADSSKSTEGIVDNETFGSLGFIKTSKK